MNKCLLIIVLIVCFIAVLSSDFQAQKGNPLPLDSIGGRTQANVTVEKNYGKMPLYFIPNKGQMDKQVYYYVQGKDKTIYFTPEGVTYSLKTPGSRGSFLKESQPSQRWVVKLEFVGAKKNVKPECLEQSGTVVSYFQGKPTDWKANLQTAAKIIYRDLWAGIDLVYYGTVNKMKYEFIVHPGADPSQIKLTYHGADGVKVNSQGQLEVQTPSGGFSDDTPVAWQEIAGKRQHVSLKYALKKEQNAANKPGVTYGFHVGKYDRNQALILDPVVIVYCGYIGGSGDDVCSGIAVDSAGCVYVTGYTTSTQNSFPVTVGPDLIYNGDNRDAFVAKVKADGTGLVYCGYIGGSGLDYGTSIAVSGSGCAYVSGYTTSMQTTFPVTGGPDLTFNEGYVDAFVAKIKADGTGLDFCGYIGGSNGDYGYGIAVDPSGCAYVAGYTGSDQTTFPVAGGPDLAFNGGPYDAFVAKVKSDGTGLDFCGYIGGSGDDKCYGIAVDASGCAYITGHTNSTETTFPVVGGPDLTYNGGAADVFVTKVKSDGTGLDFCGYIGGSGDDYSHGLVMEAAGCTYITGYTNSDQATFPVAVGPDLVFNGDVDAFVAKINDTGSALDYCGYIGGSGTDNGYGIAVDGAGCVYVTGRTQSDQSTFPVKGGPDLTFNGTQDAFTAKVGAAGTALDYCGYIGGSGDDRGIEIALDDSGGVYVAGDTYSNQATFPVTVGPDLTQNGTRDIFVAKISANPSYTVNFNAGTGGTLTGNTSQTVAQGDNCSEVEAVPGNGYIFTNWTGTNGFVTTAANPLTVTNVSSHMTITAHFVQIADGWLPVEGLQNNMIVYGKAFNGDNQAAVGDWLGAFGPGGSSDCRGITTVQASGNYYLTIGSNETSGETITFKLWPLPAGPSIDGSESITFGENGLYEGLPLHFGPREQSFNLVNGWNWISFNTLPADTSFNSVFGTPGAIEQIKSQNKAAIYTGGNWIGDLTDMSGIADGIMYKVKTDQAYSFSLTGMTVPFNTPLSLVAGWNWTAYLPTLKQPVANAVNSIITPVNQVKSQTHSVIKMDSSLFGDLVDMEPNNGYLILMNQAGVLEYPQGVSVFPDRSSTKANTAAASVWPVIKGNQYNMIATGKVYFEGRTINTAGYYLCSMGPKGETDGRSISPVKTDGSYFATILGDTGGETVKFKLIKTTNGKTYDVAGSLEFQPDNLKTGFDLKARSVKVTLPAAGAVLRVGTTTNISWEAYEVDNVKIELYKGSKLLSVLASPVPAGIRTYSWQVPPGMNTGNDFQIKVSGSDPGVTAVGWTKTFSIKPAPAIALLSPNGSEMWQVKRSYDITWRSSGIDTVKIELYKGTVLQKVISAGTAAAIGKYTWTIPANYSQGTKFKIKITGVDNGIILSDASDNYFSITSAGVPAFE